MMQHRIMECS